MNLFLGERGFARFGAAAIALATALFFVPVSLRAEQSYAFTRITDNGNTDVSAQLSVTVFESGDANLSNFGGAILATQALFVFQNNVGTASSIADVYFDDGALLGIAAIRDSGAGVAFDDPATPADLPGGNEINPDFNTTANFSADSDSPVSQNGVNSASEWVGILFDLINGMTYDDVIAALDNWTVSGNTWTEIDSSAPELRIGIHVQAIGATGGSDSYVNLPNANGPIIPEPSTILGALLAGLPISLVALRRRRRS